MHYRNGRPALNGDKIVKLEGGKIVSFGVLHSAVPGNDYCNGNIAVIQSPNDYACMCDCLHIDDVAAVFAEKGLDKRPSTTKEPTAEEVGNFISRQRAELLAMGDRLRGNEELLLTLHSHVEFYADELPPKPAGK